MEYVKDYDGLFSYKMYEYWMKIHNPQKDLKIINLINKFIKSNQTKINITHTDKKI